MLHSDYELRGDWAWDKRCVGLDTMTALYQVTYTKQPVPQAGRFLLSSVVFNRAKLAREYAAPGTVRTDVCLYTR